MQDFTLNNITISFLERYFCGLFPTLEGHVFLASFVGDIH